MQLTTQEILPFLSDTPASVLLGCASVWDWGQRKPEELFPNPEGAENFFKWGAPGQWWQQYMNPKAAQSSRPGEPEAEIKAESLESENEDGSNASSWRV